MPTMSVERENQYRAHLRKWLERVQEYLDKDAPSLILAHAVTSMFYGGLAYCPDQMTEFTSRIAADARQRVGLCTDPRCDNQVPTAQTHHPSCHVCDGRMTQQLFDDYMEGTIPLNE